MPELPTDALNHDWDLFNELEALDGTPSHNARGCPMVRANVSWQFMQSTQTNCKKWAFGVELSRSA